MRGTVSLGGAPIPDDVATRGALSFDLRQGALVCTAGFGAFGPVRYDVTLLPGRHVIAHVTDVGRSASGRSVDGVACIDEILRGCDR